MLILLLILLALGLGLLVTLVPFAPSILVVVLLFPSEIITIGRSMVGLLAVSTPVDELLDRTGIRSRDCVWLSW